MVRLDKADFEDQKQLARLARAANVDGSTFMDQFGYLAGD
jgi:hypothetical protein